MTRQRRRSGAGIPVLLTALLLVFRPAWGADYTDIPAGRFVSALATDGVSAPLAVHRFAMRTEPVTVAEFRAFVHAHPEWQRGRISPLLAGPDYLANWRSALEPGNALRPAQPVTHVSWFSARAYCASEQARLPDWYEWEYVAAADTTRVDARQDPLRNQAILAAVLASSGAAPGDIGRNPPNRYGVRDSNGLLWEWTGDYAAMFPNADSRVAGSGPTLALCGGSALAFADKNQYALIMRVAALTALKPADSAARVGFRCARDLPGE
jgi:formylglycine-generating enzyme required for sulfatase activity